MSLKDLLYKKFFQKRKPIEERKPPQEVHKKKRVRKITKEEDMNVYIFTENQIRNQYSVHPYVVLEGRDDSTTVYECRHCGFTTENEDTIKNHVLKKHIHLI